MSSSVQYCFYCIILVYNSCILPCCAIRYTLSGTMFLTDKSHDYARSGVTVMYVPDWRVFHQVTAELPSSWHQPQLASRFQQCLTVREELFRSSPASDWAKLQVHITAGESLMQDLKVDNHVQLTSYLAIHRFSYVPFSWELSLPGVVSVPPPGSLPIPSFSQWQFPWKKRCQMSPCLPVLLRMCMVKSASNCTRCNNYSHCSFIISSLDFSLVVTVTFMVVSLVVYLMN